MLQVIGFNHVIIRGMQLSYKKIIRVVTTFPTPLAYATVIPRLTFIKYLQRPLKPYRWLINSDAPIPIFFIHIGYFWCYRMGIGYELNA